MFWTFFTQLTVDEYVFTSSNCSFIYVISVHFEFMKLIYIHVCVVGESYYAMYILSDHINATPLELMND